MKILDLIDKLKEAEKEYGTDVDVQIQDGRDQVSVRYVHYDSRYARDDVQHYIVLEGNI